MDAVAFAAGEEADFLLLFAAFEVEAGAVGAAVHFAVADGEGFLVAADFFPDGGIGVEVVAELVDVGDVDRVAEFEGAVGGGFLSGDDFEEGGFAGSVAADDADDAAGGEGEVYVVKEEALVEGFG